MSTLPTTEIVICKNIPLDNSYDHTVTFLSQQAQATYFYSKAFRTLTANTYQRVMLNKLRIQVPIGDAMQCNYLFFSNNSHEGKTIYAFITGWEYVNDVTTEITYEIDVFQTFWFDIDIKPSFVEREHSNTDIIGENLVDENLEIGDYIENGSTTLMPTAVSGTVATNACALFFTTFNDDATCSNFEGGFASYVYTGLNIIKKETVNDIQAFINKAITNNKLDGIIAAYMCPYSPNTYDTITWQKQVAKNYTTLDGYTPKNNKLYTYPYNVLRIRSDSDINIYRYEYFESQYCQFNLTGIIVPEPTLSLVPIGYQSISQSRARLDQRMTLKGFPQIAIDADVFKVYLAQNAASLPTAMISSGIQSGLGVVKSALKMDFGGISTQVTDWGTSIANTLAQLHDIKTKPPQLNGTQSALTDYALGAKFFFADTLTIRAEFARIIDDYFNMFGYATHRVKVPNITGRPYWNYVKTQGVVLDIANAPQPYIQKMIDCFNKGITFWHNPSIIGNYNMNNSPIT